MELRGEGVDVSNGESTETKLLLLQSLIKLNHAYNISTTIIILQGPNYIWHVDAYDKLKPYGMSISGCIDGYEYFALITLCANNIIILSSNFIVILGRSFGYKWPHPTTNQELYCVIIQKLLRISVVCTTINDISYHNI